MKRILLAVITLCYMSVVQAQTEEKAKDLLDVVSSKMESYTNIVISFSSSLVNEDAGIKANDEPPIRGKISLQGEKYNLEYLGNIFLFDGSKLYVINNELKEVTVNEGGMSEDDGFIYPSKLFTFYKEGYTFAWGALKTIEGRKIQYVDLTPIDSNSEIVKVQLGIDAKTNHIYELIQVGSNSSKTTFTITNFKYNQDIPEKAFIFEKEKYQSLNYLID